MDAKRLPNIVLHCEALNSRSSGGEFLKFRRRVRYNFIWDICKFVEKGLQKKLRRSPLYEGKEYFIWGLLEK